MPHPFSCDDVPFVTSHYFTNRTSLLLRREYAHLVVLSLEH